MQISLVFTGCLFYIPGSHSSYDSKLNPQVSLVPDSKTLFLMTLAVSTSTDQLFCRISLIFILFDVFLTIRLELQVWGGEVTILTTSYQEVMLSSSLIIADVNLDDVAKIVFTKCPYYRLIHFPPCTLYFFGRKSLHTAHT